MLSPQGPQRSRHSIARVRRRGDRPPHSWCVSGKYGKTRKCIWKIWEDKEFLSFISGKIEWSRHLVFWLLGTLTGLRDRVRGLVV